MLIPPKYFLTPQISQHLATIEAAKEVINAVMIPPEVETNIRRQSILKSSLFSARIEGNPLTLEELATKSSQDQKRVEVFNILKALNWIRQRAYRDITTRDILELHKMSMHGLVQKQHLGKFRTEPGAIYNSSGMVVYLPPPYRQILNLINHLVRFANSQKEASVPLRAALVHYTFEKIHPFLDGSGRVGRLLIQVILHKGGYGMKGLLALEESLDNHRAIYYRALDSTERDVTDYLEFMLEAISESAQAAKEEVVKKQQLEAEDFLLPRRAEILATVRDHKLVNFDTIRRRFMLVNERTLRYDIKKLADSGLIRKRGMTKGVYYEPAR